jgi:hypothetical protein
MPPLRLIKPEREMIHGIRSLIRLVPRFGQR